MIELEDAPGFDRQAYQRDYNKTDAGKGSRKKYRHDRSKHVTDAVYLSRPIVAIDGEGINVRSGPNKGAHLYVELALSGVAPITSEVGLSTRQILSYLWSNLKTRNINVIYGGSYDFNCWLADCDEDTVRAIYRSSYTSKPIYFAGFGIRWIKGKSFEITHQDKTVTINDVISFFQRPFVQACDEYLGEYAGRQILVDMKAKRGNFTYAEITEITSYNDLELKLLVELVTELRQRLNKVGLRPRRWNSPGAIASALFVREGVKKHRNENLPQEVRRAARFAYAGGRFEMLKYGSVKTCVYEYDINSAYPRALLEVPSLVGGSWVHHDKTQITDAHFSLYRVRYTGTDPSIPGPLFHRGENGTISYPLNVTNWIWTPEYETLKEYCSQIAGAKFTVLEQYEYVEPRTDAAPIRPFAFILALYNLRKQLKELGDGAHVGIKLALNSIYGKLAQQVGWRPASGDFPLRVPTYHQLEWAGYVTSWCRANVLRAALTNISAIIAFETDAVFSDAPLFIDESKDLGGFERTDFNSLTYVQSGHYYGTERKPSGELKEIIKCRGIDKGFISRKRVEKLLSLPEPQRTLSAELTRFYGVGIAIARGLSKYWRKWITEPKLLQLRPTGKRLHGNCGVSGCTVDGPLQMGVWHSTYCPTNGGVSSEYPVEWENPNPAMTELSEMRESENYYAD